LKTTPLMNNRNSYHSPQIIVHQRQLTIPIPMRDILIRNTHRRPESIKLVWLHRLLSKCLTGHVFMCQCIDLTLLLPTIFLQNFGNVWYFVFSLLPLAWSNCTKKKKCMIGDIPSLKSWIRPCIYIWVLHAIFMYPFKWFLNNVCLHPVI
jgi:hypothetical protein